MSLFKQINLDVSNLEAPEPMRQILMALGLLTPGQYLAVSHRKEPVPLYQKLDDMGFAYFLQCNNSKAAEFLLTIAFKADADAIQALLDQEKQ